MLKQLVRVVSDMYNLKG